MQGLARGAYEGYVPRMGREPAPMQVDYVEVVARGHAWVAEKRGRILGLLVLEPADGYLLLDNVAVAPDSRGTGIGSQLLKLAEKEARSLGLAEVRLYTNEVMTENLDYYPRRGYLETHRAVQDGYRRVFFAKVIDGSEPPAAI